MRQEAYRFLHPLLGELSVNVQIDKVTDYEPCGETQSPRSTLNYSILSVRILEDGTFYDEDEIPSGLYDWIWRHL